MVTGVGSVGAADVICMHVQEVQQDKISVGSGEAKRQAVGNRPMFLHRNAVESIDVKPW